ncbi:MAG TPA: benzoate-CoA ligase family protein, partial [Acidobacteriota bacterium]|nr:benzoate-CoA ligase family protein [Acidobacteriota bacterium]
CIEFVAVWFGILKIGAVVTMVNTILPAADYEYYLNYTRAKVVVVHESVLSRVEEVRDRAPHLKTMIVVGKNDGKNPSYENLMAGASPSLENADTHRDDIAIWLFTSGTTGKPKGAVHFHHDFAYNTECYAKQIMQIRESDITLSVPKLFFGYATGTNLMFPFAVGAATALFEERSTADTLFAMIRKYKPTVLTTVPTLINAMLEHEEAESQDLSCLRLAVTAGEALPPELYHRWKRAFGVELLDGIGSAELFHIYISNRIDDIKPGSLGKVVPGYEAKIVGPDGAEAPEGEIGTLWVKGDSAAVYYWQAHEKSKEVLRGDWVVSADLFSRDADGYFWYAGRADDMLKVSGIFVSPLEIENCLLQHPAVRDVCVIGHTDRDGLVKTKAFVVLHERYTAGETMIEELKIHTKERLAPYKYPRIFEFVPDLPRNDRGKVERQKLRDR